MKLANNFFAHAELDPLIALNSGCAYPMESVIFVHVKLRSDATLAVHIISLFGLTLSL